MESGVPRRRSRGILGLPTRIPFVLRFFVPSTLLVLALLVGCADPPAPEAAALVANAAVETAAVEGAAHEASYSPFVVHMSRPQGLPFQHISFKDVGMSLPEDERVMAYETLAESLSLELQRAIDDVSVEVRHTVEILDPAAHLACEGQHIYVDLWRAGEGWGYSLWSGCGEEDEFAHEEVEPVRVAIAGSAESFEPLARDIAESLVDATRTGCFTRDC